MKFVYQTKIAGSLEPPARNGYRIAAMKLAAFCPGRTFFKGSFIKDPFRETLGLLSRAGANALERSGGSAVDPAKNPENAFKVLFAKETERMDSVISKKNFGIDEDGPENEDGAGPLYEGSALDFILSRDTVYLNGNAAEDDILAIMAANILRSRRQKIVPELPPEKFEMLEDYAEAVNSLGGEASVLQSGAVFVNGEKPLTAGNTILPASDWRVVIPGLLSSALGFEVVVKNAFSASPFAKKKDFIDILTQMRLTYVEDEDGNAFFTNGENKVPTRIDAKAAGDCLPYLLFLATQTDGVTEIHNITEDIIEKNGRAFYYAVAELKKLGVDFTSRCRGSMFVIGRNSFDGGIRIDCHNNFAVTAVAVLSTLCSKKANVLENCDETDILCPDFWRLFKTIGGFVE